MKLQDAVVLLTGGGTGIGRALALQLAAAGARVVVCGRRQGPRDTVAAEHERIEARAADVSRPVDVAALVEGVQATHGRLDVLVNNAGVQVEAELGDAALDPEDIARQIDVNLTGPARLIHAALPLLRQRPEAAIVNVTSALALTPKRSSPVYCATKAGLRSLTRALRYALEDTQVRVIEVLPPLVETPMTAHRGGRKRSPDDVARQTLAALRADRPEVLVGGAKPLALAERLSPWLVRRVMRRR